MKRLLMPIFLLVSACSTAPPRTLPPVVDGRTGETVTEPDMPAPSEGVAAPIPVPEKPARSGGAVVALLGQADQYRSSGDNSNEAATIERALRIEPNNPRLWSRLSAVRLEQGRPRQTEQLALKSNALAKGDKRLQAANWRLIARARWAMNDTDGARRAERKASDLGG